MKAKMQIIDNTVDISAISLGKMPPANEELERAILGAMMLENDCLEDNLPLLSESMFYLSAHKNIFKAIVSLHTKQVSIDILTVTNRLKETGELDKVGGPYYISTITNNISSSANIETHIAIIKQLYLKRRQVEICAHAMEGAFDLNSDVFEDISLLESSISGLNDEVISGTTDFDIASSMQRTIKHLLSSCDKEYPGLPTGNTQLSVEIGGWQSPDLIILAARPSQGKTAKALDFACKLADKNIPIAFFSLETKTEHKINIRILSRYAGLDNYVVKSGKWDNEQMERISRAHEAISSLPLYIYDKASITPNEIRSICRKLKRSVGLGMVFIDFLQLVTPNEHIRGNREQEVSQMSRFFKIMAKDIDIPVMLLCQLNREIENRTDKRPRPSDLRESGAIEQDADLILGLYNPAQNGDETLVSSNYCSREAFESVQELCILKNKEGGIGKSIIEFYHRPTSRYFIEESDILNQQLPF